MDDKTYDQSRAVHAEIKQDIAEADRDAAVDAAAVNAVERDVAMDSAAHEAIHRDVAEAQAVDARINANQANAAAREIATDRNIIHHELQHERAAAANNAFGFYLTLAVLACVLLFGGYWLYERYNAGPDVVVAAPSPSAPNTTHIVTPGPSPSPVVPVQVPTPAPAPPASDNRPINIQVPPPEVKVNITPPSSTSGAENPGTSGTSSSEGSSSGGTTNP